MQLFDRPLRPVFLGVGSVVTCDELLQCQRWAVPWSKHVNRAHRINAACEGIPLDL